jgi:hypothetical protein
MALNPNISLGVRPIELPNQLAQYAQLSQIQNAQQANQLNRMQMAEYERARSEEQTTRNFLGAADLTDPKVRAQLLTGYGKSGREIYGKLSEAEKAQTEEAARRAKLMQDTQSMYQNISGIISNKADAVKFLSTVVNDPALKDSPLAKIPLMEQVARIPEDPAGLDNWKKQFALGATKYISENKPQYFQQDTGATKQIVGIAGLGGPATVVPGSVQTVTMTPAQEREAKDSATRIKQEGQRIGLEGRRVVVLEANAQRDKDPAFQQAMATARATGEAIAKNDVAAKQALPRILSDAQTALDVVDQMVGKQEVRDAKGNLIQAATKPHPGFQNAVGATWLPGARFVPGTNAAGFQALQDQIEGTAFLSAFEALKGGGAISEKEGAKATAARLRMTLAQDEKEYIKAAREFQDIVRTGVDNARRKVGGGASSAAPTNAANIDALLKKYE